MPDLSHRYTGANVPFGDLDAPVGYPFTGSPKSNAGLQSWNVTTAAAQVVTLPNPHSTENRWIRVDVVTLTAETYAVLASYDGGTSYPEAPVMVSLSTGALTTPATLAAGSYLVTSTGISNLKFTKSGAVNPGVACVAWGSHPKG